MKPIWTNHKAPSAIYQIAIVTQHRGNKELYRGDNDSFLQDILNSEWYCQIENVGSRGNLSDFYSLDTCLELQPGRRLSRMGYFVVVFGSQGKFRHITQNQATTTSYHILSISLFTNHSNIWRCILWTTDSIFKSTIDKYSQEVNICDETNLRWASLSFLTPSTRK
jgi:hypothetical protein